MGFIKPNPLIGEINGKIGGLYIAHCGRKFVIKRRPSTRQQPATAAQERARERLEASLYYWKRVKTDPELTLAYRLAASRKEQRAYDLAKADFLHPPEVTNIDLAEYLGHPPGTIRVQASDDFEVEQVRVTVMELDGTVIEGGDAALVDGVWEYSAHTDLPVGKAVMIEAVATDHPQHSTSKRVDHIVRAPRESA